MGNGKMPRIRGDVLRRLTLGYFYGSYISWLASSAFLTQHGIHANNACVAQFCNLFAEVTGESCSMVRNILHISALLYKALQQE